MKKIIIILYITLNIAFSQDINPLKEKYIKKINSDNLMNIVSFLASKELQGRLPGDAGYEKAALYCADKFSKFNLKPYNNNSYLQEVFVEYNRILPGYLFEIIDPSNKIKKLKLGKDFVFRGFTGSGDIYGKFVFCGYGIKDEKLNYDDYTNVDVQNKIVVVFKYNPRWKISEKSLETFSLRRKAHLAKKNGALAIVFISFPNDKDPQKPIGSLMDGDEEHLEDFPMLHLDLSIANELFENKLSELQSWIDSNKATKSFESSFFGRIKVNAQYNKNAKAYNVAGILEGNDPVLKNEYIVIGAHLDHVGSQADEIYFPGANDNASGSAAVIELARLFSEAKLNLKRSIIFVLFTSEELGLKGAQYFVDNLIIPKEKIVAMLNFDCIGHGDSLQIGNGKSVPHLYELAKNNDNQFTKIMISETWSGGGADATPFHNIGIPSLYFVSKYSYTHLHLQSDLPETLNKDLLTKILQVAFATIYDIAIKNYDREKIINNL